MSDFEKFWPFYVSQHSNRTCRRLHFAGTTLAIGFVVLAFTHDGRWAWLAPVAGYGFAWVGHFFFEHNRPATFQAPLASLRGDFRLYSRMWRRKSLE